MTDTTRTPDQQDADDALDLAITNVLRSRDMLGVNEHLDRWVIVVATADPTESDRVAHAVLHVAGGQPAYIALGLLEVGRQIVTAQADADD